MSLFHIEPKKTKIKYGYIGMNRFAAKAHNIPFHHKHRGTLEIYNGVPKKVRKHTIKHEEIEYLLMRKGMNYHKAHNTALKYEKSPKEIKYIMGIIKKHRRLE